MTPHELYTNLVMITHGQEFGDRKCAIACPYCGKESSPTDLHCAFGYIFTENNSYGFHCFVCGASVSLENLYKLFTNQSIVIDRVDKVVTEKAPRYWQTRINQLLSRFTGNKDKYQAWERYKHVGPNLVDKYHLGLGKLPDSRCIHKRLVTPIFSSGQPVWFRGRAYKCECQKWLGSKGVSPTHLPLLLSEHVKPGQYIFIVENYVDALLVNEHSPYAGIPTLSVSYWGSSWTEEIRALKPKHVIIAYDADVAGNGPINRAHLLGTAKKRLQRRLGAIEANVEITSEDKTGWIISWRYLEAQGTLKIPIPNGVKLANKLLAAGLPVTLAKWENEGDDIGMLYDRDQM